MYLIVTTRQFQEGYYEMIGGIVYHRDYGVVRKDGPDTWKVHEPEQRIQNRRGLDSLSDMPVNVSAAYNSS